MRSFPRRTLALRGIGLKALVMALVFAPLGCIGTDFINDPLAPMQEPRLEITPPSAAILVGETVRFMATYYDTEGLPAPVPISWESSDAALAEVDAEGEVSGRGSGQVMITARAEGIASMPAMLTIVADPNEVAQVVVAPDTVLLEVNAFQSFTASALNLTGATIDGVSFAWNSDDPTVATIDANGRARAVASGTAQITATADGIVSLPAILRVLGARRVGDFQARAGTSYTVEGTAILEEELTGGLVLSFGDDFRSSSGPALEVYLSTTNGINGTSLSLGDLKGTLGAQTYRVPDNVALDTFDWVVIHCVPFNVTFGFAQLK